jgi:hypothetical protein
MNTTNTNTVPGNLQRKHNNIILLAIYNVYNAILQVHGIYTIYSSFLRFAFLQNPLDLLDMKTRQINEPPAEITRQKNPPWQLAGFMCDFNPLNLLARDRRQCNSRYLLARENPPSLLRIPRQDPARHPPPPQQHDTTYAHSIQSGSMNESITILLLGEGIIARKG